MAIDNRYGPHESAGGVVVGTTRSVCTDYAAADVRDAFLASLDERNDARTVAIARHLVRCGNPLPSVTCATLGIAVGSSYGAGALAVLARASAK